MKDLLLNDEGDLDIINGDLVIGDSFFQNLMLIIDSFKGEWKQHLVVGFGAKGYLKGNINKDIFIRDLKVAIEMDGIDIDSLHVSSDLRKLSFEIDS